MLYFYSHMFKEVAVHFMHMVNRCVEHPDQQKHYYIH